MTFLLQEADSNWQAILYTPRQVPAPLDMLQHVTFPSAVCVVSICKHVAPMLPRYPTQVLYAARNALVTLHCYRRLRLWHHMHNSAAASGKPCQVL